MKKELEGIVDKLCKNLRTLEHVKPRLSPEDRQEIEFVIDDIKSSVYFINRLPVTRTELLRLFEGEELTRRFGARPTDFKC